MNIAKRFLKYVSYPTMSDGESKTTPSSSKQLALGNYLVNELNEIGMKNVKIDGHGYVYAFLPSNVSYKTDSIGFIAHMDTSSAASDTDIKARLVEYKGGDIVLNEKENIVMKVSDFPSLEDFIGQTLIVTDGKTLLGADDKAGIANIVTAMEHIIKNNIPHGNVSVCFTPDEEIGRGADKFDVKFFGADYAYTVDGGILGELEYENFNAAGAHVKVNGVSMHPGYAKGKMKNAALIACEYNGLLPENEIPEMTEGYEGFHFLSSISGSTELAELSYIIRDHDKTLLERKKKDFTDIGDKLNKKYGEGTVVVALHDSYSNMKEIMDNNMYIVERMKKAMIKEGVEPVVVPVRGGTDGARLSFMGLPCPNICTGGANFHSRFEFASVDAMEKIAMIIVRAVEDCGMIEK